MKNMEDAPEELVLTKEIMAHEIERGNLSLYIILPRPRNAPLSERPGYKNISLDEIDIEDKPRAIFNPKGRVVERAEYKIVEKTESGYKLKRSCVLFGEEDIPDVVDKLRANGLRSPFEVLDPCREIAER